MKAPIRKLVTKVSVLLLLLTSALRILGSDCSSSQAAGWDLWMICEANFDPQGQYVDSSCHLADPPSGGQTTANMCKETTFSDGTRGCSGSVCTWS